VPRPYAAEALHRSRARVAAEAGKRRQLADGVLGLDLYDLRTLLERLGVEYVEKP
jgi:4-hydroxy-4-methyl-2-oxoglutarate aldolase